MAETILSRAIRGLGSSLRFTGSIAGPPGVDLSRASTPVNDLTQYARYGAALVFNQLQDGWVTATWTQQTSAQGFNSATHLWDTQVSGAFGIAQNALSGMMCWIYNISVIVSADTALGDIGPSMLLVPIEQGIGPGGAGSSDHRIWLNDGFTGTNQVAMNTLELNLVNMMLNSWAPFPWAPGAAVHTRVHQLNAGPNVVTWRWTLLCRLLPFGVPPLP